MTTIFEKLQNEQFQAQITPRTKESTEWLRKKIQTMSRMDAMKVINSPELQKPNTIELGSMVMFAYEATKGTVIRKTDTQFKKKRKSETERMDKNIIHPGFYDKFPVVIVTDIYEGNKDMYLEGINIHYLAPLDRARLLDRLLDKTDGANFDIQHLYTTIKMMSRGHHPGFKKYAFSNIQSRLAQITEDEWEIATFLPTSEFVNIKNKRGLSKLSEGAPNKNQVYRWSKRKL